MRCVEEPVRGRKLNRDSEAADSQVNYPLK